MADETCRHCGYRIVLVNAGRRDEFWTHQPAGASFMDHSHRACHTTHAAPKEATHG